jgi:hypothetical protein
LKKKAQGNILENMITSSQVRLIHLNIAQFLGVVEIRVFLRWRLLRHCGGWYFVKCEALYKTPTEHSGVIFFS